MDDAALKAALEASPSPNRVTKEYMESRIAKVDYFGPEHFGGTMTLCQITLDNGFTTHGTSACADPANYKQDIGEHYAYERAFGTLWPLFGFLLKEKMHREAQPAPTFNKTHKALSFFASCIRSGEDWTEHCQKAMDEAKAELTAASGGA